MEWFQVKCFKWNGSDVDGAEDFTPVSFEKLVGNLVMSHNWWCIPALNTFAIQTSGLSNHFISEFCAGNGLILNCEIVYTDIGHWPWLFATPKPGGLLSITQFSDQVLGLGTDCFDPFWKAVALVGSFQGWWWYATFVTKLKRHCQPVVPDLSGQIPIVFWHWGLAWKRRRLAPAATQSFSWLEVQFEPHTVSWLALGFTQFRQARVRLFRPLWKSDRISWVIQGLNMICQLCWSIKTSAPTGRFCSAFCAGQIPGEFRHWG